ncbi:xylulokinase [Mycoplana sp. BE70]|uniref:xylulokinase n=1 Tax=Mycoplana sp. BE70 TaxID=2817775 RepID=UPI00285A975E|nr:FGGY family carbohydrate kinase [Mycoplana sp. BE70]MDR6756365.1 xylulokinase [Mycoplana sp. BE70]
MPATSPTYLGLDLGTSSLKALLVAADGQVIAEASANYPTLRPQVGWTEQDPADWRVAMADVVKQLQARAPESMARVTAVGFCSAAHLPVLLDQAGEVIRPAILWSDQRSAVEVAQLRATHGEHIRRVTLNEPSCTWTLPQLMWIAANEAGAIERAAMLLSSKDYLIHLLTGVYSMDLTSAVATLLYDVPSGRWDADLVQLAGLKPSALPPVCASATVVGRIGEGRECFGLPAGVAVVSGGLDSAAEMVACAGRSDTAPAVIRVGSSAAILAPCKAVFRPGLLNYPHAIRPGHYLQAGTNAGAVALQWARQFNGNLSHGEVDSAVLATPPGAEGLLFHPYLQGERAPFWNPDLRGSFSGLHTGHGNSHFLRAVMEGVALSLRDCMERLSVGLPDAAGTRLAGGVTRGRVWPQILADVLGRPLETVEHAESAIGAAFIAMRAVSGEAAVPEVRVKAVVRPRPEIAYVYNEAFERYQRLADFMDAEYRRRQLRSPELALPFQ